ncbi:hypothetical protein B0J11DRAFT_506261 [Dendryphion nanum]|uniref:Uncharacterized protein n=1 Tax=Dendryphion nanum TaxID=256645 RepID=A0A9P9DVR4_9PLEO|nr:hypothetical protein B0J11DRAFT_506261 [Dendryphion nanum]
MTTTNFSNNPPTSYQQLNQPHHLQNTISSLHPSTNAYDNTQTATMPPAPPTPTSTLSTASTINTSYQPFRQDAQNQFQNYSRTPSPQPTGLAQEYYNQTPNSTLSLPGDAPETDRGLFSHSSSPGDKSKKKELVDKGVKFVVKRIEKKMNKQSHGGGGHGQEMQNAMEEHVYGGEGQQTYGEGGDYGYGAAEQGYGYPEGMFDGVQGSGMGDVEGAAGTGAEFDWGELLAF